MPSSSFEAPSQNKRELEEGDSFTPRFDAQGLIAAVVVDASDGAILMLAHMNAEALALTLRTGVAHYWSRSRKTLWKKGETSGNLQHVEDVLTDCDQDAVVLRVRVDGDGVSCHTGRRSCFYRAVAMGDGPPSLRTASDRGESPRPRQIRS